MRALARRVVPRPIKRIYAKLRKMIIYTNADSTAYWRKRATTSSGSKVMWPNEGYNELYRQIQAEVIQPYLDEMPDGALALDIGCGLGAAAHLMVQGNPTIQVDAVDFPEMINAAKAVNMSDRIRFIASSAEEYLDTEKQYDFVMSSGCFSVIRNIPALEQAIRNAAQMTRPNGIVLMMDPFHTWNYLARAKYGADQVITLMNELGFDLILRRGALFWPYREFLAVSDLKAERLKARFEQGERLLKRLGDIWADYKILAFRKRVVM